MHQPVWVLWLVLTWTNWRVLPLAMSRSTAHFAACWLFLSRSTATMVELSFPASGSPLCDAVENAERYISQLSDRPTKQPTGGRGRERQRGDFVPPPPLLISPALPGRGLLVPCCRDQCRPKPQCCFRELVLFCLVWTQCGREDFLNFLWLLFPRFLSKGCRREDHLFNATFLLVSKNSR